MKRINKSFAVSLCLLAMFVFWTVAVCFVDVQPIGPQETCVGFAGLNRLVHDLTGVHFGLYNLTDWLGLVPFLVCMGFGALGLAQWIRRGSIRKVDFDILVLGGFYVVTVAAYLLFENVVINYRPVLIDGFLEASYPSSTTMLVLCVMPTAMMQWNRRIRSRGLRRVLFFIMAAFVGFMVMGRLLSGVHWFTDIVGGALLSGGFVTMYASLSGKNGFSQQTQ